MAKGGTGPALLLLPVLGPRRELPCGKGPSSRESRYGRTSIGTRSRTEAGMGLVVVPARVVVVGAVARASSWAAWSCL